MNLARGPPPGSPRSRRGEPDGVGGVRRVGLKRPEVVEAEADGRSLPIRRACRVGQGGSDGGGDVSGEARRADLPPRPLGCRPSKSACLPCGGNAVGCPKMLRHGAVETQAEPACLPSSPGRSGTLAPSIDNAAARE